MSQPSRNEGDRIQIKLDSDGRDVINLGLIGIVRVTKFRWGNRMYVQRYGRKTLLTL